MPQHDVEDFMDFKDRLKLWRDDTLLNSCDNVICKGEVVGSATPSE